MNDKRRTLILGASPNPSRVSFQATELLQLKGHEVLAIGIRKGLAGTIPIRPADTPPENVHTISLYLNPQRQQDYYEYILETKPKRLIFNPGAENPELSRMAREAGIETIQACTLVMLSIGTY